MIDVSTLSTGGTGTSANPWAGWDSAVWQPETEYFWPGGTYSWSASGLNLLATGIAHRGEAGTVLKFTGTGNAVAFDNPGGLSPPYRNWTQNVRFENFIIQGNANCTNGLFLRAVRNGVFRHISVRDVSCAGLWAEACVTNIAENFRCTHHEMPNDAFAVRPKYGIVLAARNGDTTTTFIFTNPVVEGVGVIADNSGIGIWVKPGCYGNKFIGGTSEGNFAKGAVLDGWLNTFDGTDFEVNAGGIDVEINHSYNELRGVYSANLIDVKAGQLNKVCGRLKDVKIANICDFTDVSGAYMAGTLTDNSLSTTRFAYQTGAGLQYQGRIAKALVGSL